MKSITHLSTIKVDDEYGNPTKHPAPYPSCIIIWRKK